MNRELQTDLYNAMKQVFENHGFDLSSRIVSTGNDEYASFQIDGVAKRVTQIGPNKIAERAREIALAKKHQGHEVVENTVAGQTFKYCRQCKVEVA